MAVALDVDHLIGRSCDRTDRLDDRRLDEYRALLGLSPEEAPLAAHWALFDRMGVEFRPDGHPLVMEPLPPMSYPRRMWAGGELIWYAPLLREVRLTRVSSVTAVERKKGSGSCFLLVRIQHRISAEDLLVDERQDIVLLPEGRFTGRRKVRPVDFEISGTTSIALSVIDLFRYSALTSNAHRIHYDADYTREVEGYPGLVVQGPLLAAILMQRAARAALPWVPVSFTYRAERPAFLGEDIRVVWSSQDNEQIRIAALTADDGVAMSAVLFVQPPFKETAP